MPQEFLNKGMDSKNQFVIFCLCLAVGFVGGLLYEFFGFIRLLFKCNTGKNKFIGITLDISFFLSFAFICVLVAYLFRFPEFRVYMSVGYGVGGVIYLKTLHRMVAFFGKVCYNMLTKVIKKTKNSRKTREEHI